MLEVRNLYKSFDVAGKRQRVIEDLSFVVQDRDFYMILGQSGCGKSTLLRMLGGHTSGWSEGDTAVQEYDDGFSGL